MIQIYEAVCEGTDGLDRKVFARFTTEEAAREAVKGKGPMGHGDGTVQGPITIYESFKDYQKNNPDAVRQRALKKLTPEERKALNLS